MDLICDTLGVELWLNRLKWAGLEKFQEAEKVAFQNNADYQTAGFAKTYKNLSLFYLMRAGHMVAYDAPLAANHVVQEVLRIYN
uniref:Serine carboxypeptidase n=1 Tax=Steinernema glaseri TaxID=37863 RepID=A0A1I7ZP10_9BILA